MTDPTHYTTTYGLQPRQARRAAAIAMACVTLGLRYTAARCAVDAVLDGGMEWTSRATWSMARIALRRSGWQYCRVTRSVGFGWWCLCWVDGMEDRWSVFVDAGLRVHEYGPVTEKGRLV